MTSLYDAIMKAADHIERNPGLFAYHAIYVPTCGTPACALGWIGHFAGAKDPDRRDGNTNVRFVETEVLRQQHGNLYVFMSLATPGWENNHLLCAHGLRLYAEKYHGHEKAPDWNAIASARTVADEVRSQELVS